MSYGASLTDANRRAEQSGALCCEQSAVEPAAAELVEPKAETKGNADQQSTRRDREPGER